MRRLNNTDVWRPAGSHTLRPTEGGPAQHTAVETTRTWPNPEDVGDFSFIAYGDNRYANSSPTFNGDHRDVACLGILGDARPAGAALPKFVLHVGDFVYDGGHADEWIPHFFRPAGALVSRMPLFPCVGNHETRADSSASKFVDLFNVPQNATNPDHKERYYWFNYGDCYFVVLDTNLPFGEGSDQYNWLIGEQGCLTRTDFRNARWLFVVLHCPPYTDGRTVNRPPGVGRAHEWNDTQDVRPVRETLAPIFESSTSPRVHRKADVVFSGHNHFYERSVYNGVHYIVTGGGGAPLHDPWPDEPPEHMDNDNRQIAVMCRHYCRVDVPSVGPLLLGVFDEEGGLIEEVEIE